MHRSILRGIYPPVASCFTANGQSVNLEGMQANISRLSKSGINGIVVFGSNGEFPLLTHAERAEILTTCQQVLNATSGGGGKRLHMIVGTGAESLHQTLENCKQAHAHGADAVLVLSPWYFKGGMTPDALVDYFTAVADASPLPLVLYNMPANTGVDLEVETIVQLAGHKNVIGLKDSSGNIAKVAAVVHQTRGINFEVMAGSAGFLLPALQMGATGGVLALANVVPRDCVRLYDLYMRTCGQPGSEGETKPTKNGIAGNDSSTSTNSNEKVTDLLKQALDLQHRCVAPNALVTRKYGVPGLKAVMDAFGFTGGPVRSPLRPVSTQVRDAILNSFSSNGFKPEN